MSNRLSTTFQSPQPAYTDRTLAKLVSMAETPDQFVTADELSKLKSAQAEIDALQREAAKYTTETADAFYASQMEALRKHALGDSSDWKKLGGEIRSNDSIKKDFNARNTALHYDSVSSADSVHLLNVTVVDRFHPHFGVLTGIVEVEEKT